MWIHEGSKPVSNRDEFDDVDMDIEYGNHLDPFHDIQQQLFDTFDLGDSTCVWLWFGQGYW